MGICPDCLLSAGFGTVSKDANAEKLRTFQPPRPDELARHFPQLEILELLGRGGMGAVYKARQRELDRTVALKILPPGIGDEAGFAERFSREAKALAKLNHPGIVTIHDFGRADGLYYFVMEYVDGVNLRELLQSQRISPREALAIVPQICDALQFAHDHGIVHRDIKPENILMDRRGRVKVADFGIAKLAEATDHLGASPESASTTFTEAGEVLGTPSYMAPEQASHPGEVDHRADIYALGVVFYQMLTGELPGKRIEPPSTKVKIDVRLDEIVLRALERKPELRYQQASALKTHVETVASSGNANESPAPTRSSRLREWFAARHRGMPKVLWLPVALLSLSILSKFMLILHRGPSALADILFQAIVIGGLWYRFRLAYPAVIVSGLFMLPALARIEPAFALLGVAITTAVIVPVLWSTSWFFPIEMNRIKRRAWLWSTAALALLATAIGFAVPPSMIISGPAARRSTPRATDIVSMPAYKASSAPFVARYRHGTVELIALAPHPSNNAKAWLPNGAPSDYSFPEDHGKNEAAGKVVREMAFRVHSSGGEPGSPVVEFDAKSGVLGMGMSQSAHHKNDVRRLTVKALACPPATTQTHVRIGIADGPWEDVFTMPSGGSQLYGSRQESGVNGQWEAGFEGIRSDGGGVALSFNFIKREEWETRLAAVTTNGSIKAVPSSRLKVAGGLWQGMTSFTKDEFAAITEFRLQRRKYDWVEFRNVSLVPGYRTIVEISNASPAGQVREQDTRRSGAREPQAPEERSARFEQIGKSRFAQIAQPGNLVSLPLRGALLESDPAVTLALLNLSPDP
jgi:serine/threonine protein kinase